MKVSYDTLRIFVETACPNDFDDPSHGRKPFGNRFVASDVAIEFLVPELGVGVGTPAARTIVTVPEAAVDEYNGFVFRQNDVRRARQISSVEAESKSGPKERGPHGPLGARILAANTRHDFGSFFRSEAIDHDFSQPRLGANLDSRRVHTGARRIFRRGSFRAGSEDVLAGGT